jgi:hypothetical protein
MERLSILDFLLFPSEQEAQSRAHSGPYSTAFFSADGADSSIVSPAVARGESFLPLQHSEREMTVTPDERQHIPALHP